MPTSSRTAIPEEFRNGTGAKKSGSWRDQPITPGQLGFIRDLLDKKDLFASPSFFDKVNAMDADEYAAYLEKLKKDLAKITKGRAHDIIDALRVLPDKEKPITDKQMHGEPKDKLPNVPAGRYALEFPSDRLNPVRFYRVRDGKDNTERGGKNWKGAKFVDRFASDDTYPVKYRSKEYFRVLTEIAADPLAAAQRYGDEFKSCSICGRGLTRRLSRELRIGPVCLSRQDWVPDTYVSEARAAIIARGENPDEVIS